nr:hypothetical protein [Tanacetum cinerariifolium]
MYGALIPKEMINQEIKDSKSYKTYLDIATGKDSPKKSRKFKKVDSPSKKLSPVLEEEPTEKPKRAKKSTKKSTTVPTAGVVIRDTPGHYLKLRSSRKLSKKSRWKLTSFMQVARMMELVPNQSDVGGDNESSDSEKIDSDEDENPNLNQNDDEEETYKEEYLLTPDNYEFTDDNDEEYEELYKDVNVRGVIDGIVRGMVGAATVEVVRITVTRSYTAELEKKAQACWDS